MTNWVDLPAPMALPAGQTDHAGLQALAWAKKHCPSYITNDGIQLNGVWHYRFYFGREQDQIIFALKWL